MHIWAALLALVVGAFVVTRKAEAKKMNASTPAEANKKTETLPYESLFREAGNNYGIDWRLIAAHAKAESNFKENAFNPEKGSSTTDGSYGLMQIYVVRDDAGSVTNPMNVPGWPPVKGREYDPAWNINAGAAIIAENLERYDYPRCIAVYNSYDQRKLPVDGPFKNQAYVNKVRGFYEDFQQRFTE